MRNQAISTKSKILEKSISMLNNRGLSNVKMRDVSDELGISVGNLTYHYPKWENLMDDIIEQFLQEKEDMNSDYPKDIIEVVDYIDKIYHLQLRYAFLFSNFYTFFQLFPKYKEIEKKFFAENMEKMRNSLNKLIEKKLLKPEDKIHNYDLIVKNTWLLLSGWYSFSMMFKNSKYAITKEEFYLSIYNMYVYHLTEKGRELVIESYTKYVSLQKKNESTIIVE